MSWKIYRVVPPDFVLNKPQNFQFSIVPESINENNLFLVSPKEESVTDSLAANEQKVTFISLIELAEDSGKTPLNFLRKSIRLKRVVFVRLKGQGRLIIFDEINAETKEGTFQDVDLKNQLWELPESELEQMLLEQPTEEIKNDGSQLSSENQSINKTKTEHIAADEDNGELNKSSIKDFENIKITGKRKPHTAFVVIAKTEMKMERDDAWKELKDLAQESIGKTEVKMPGWGKIYLRRVRLKSETEILFSHEPFDFDKDENLPNWVKRFTRVLFNSSWDNYR
jgi:hypothetical protein